MSVKIRVEGGEAILYQRTKNRVIFAGGVYHVIQRAPGQELLFRENKDYFYFQHLLSRTSKEFGVNFICFSLLPNHVHLLLQLTEKNLSDSMKHLFESYAMTFNKKYKRKGHVFYGNFRAMVCDSDSYLLAATVYIHLNAFKAGLCETFDSYRWHSLDLYLSSFATDKLVKSSFVLSKLNEDRNLACQEYQKILEEMAKRPIRLGRTVRDIPGAVRGCMTNGKPVWSGVFSSTFKRKMLTNRFEKALSSLNRILELRNKGFSREAIQSELGISKATYFRALQKEKTAGSGLE